MTTGYARSQDLRGGEQEQRHPRSQGIGVMADDRLGDDLAKDDDDRREHQHQVQLDVGAVEAVQPQRDDDRRRDHRELRAEERRRQQAVWLAEVLT